MRTSEPSSLPAGLSTGAITAVDVSLCAHA